MFERFVSSLFETGERSEWLEPLLSQRQRAYYSVAIGVWLIIFASLWIWWLQPEHNLGYLRLLLNSAVLGWLTLLPLYFLFFFSRAQRMSANTPLPRDARIAMVVTKAPSEPFSVIRKTLEGMLAQNVPHDTWLADEAPDAETRAWCKANNVHISTRYGIKEYHQANWPRRTKCKEGNLAYFYDRFGYDNYDFVVQLDADHVPAPGYLKAMIQPFVDDRVGYVSAPSICDREIENNWAARGRLVAESTFHGLLQAGYTAGWAPICIGSHYAVRTKALKEAGGLGPELAEDHSTTLILNAAGWRGVHAFDAIANGLGPKTFSDLVTQEFQWARSLVTILLRYSPIYVPRLKPHLKFQFLFCQFWYPLLSLFMLVIFLLPIVALLMGERFVDVEYYLFFLFFVGLEACACVLAVSWRDNGWCRPRNVKILCWEAFLFPFVKWPWVMAGTLVAVWDHLAGVTVGFRVTPKDNQGKEPFPWRAIAPYSFFALLSVGTVWVIDDPGDAAGFYIFATLNAVLYVAIVGAVIKDHVDQNGMPFGFGIIRNYAPLTRVAATIAFILAAVSPIAAFAPKAPISVEAITWGQDWFRITKTTYSVSGASVSGRNARRVEFHWPDWAQ